MALSIKDRETERLARALAEHTGESLTLATRRALEERLRRVRGDARRAAGGPRGDSPVLQRAASRRSPKRGRNHWLRPQRPPQLMHFKGADFAGTDIRPA